MFAEKDIKQITDHGLTIEIVDRQIACFRQEFPALRVNRAATVGDGIRQISPRQATHYSDLFRQLKIGRKVVKFVPASGAATRMFKELFEYLNEGKMNTGTREMIDNLNQFAFGAAIQEITKSSNDPKQVISAILSPEGLGYGKAPKALILFHRYDTGNRTALEEHLVEGAMYAASTDRKVDIHFTVSSEHRAGFESLVANMLSVYEKEYHVKYTISYSQQAPKTDTIAVTPDNEPFRNDDGSLVFRPAGHGALLWNLNQIDADIVFIKNIDNVTTDTRKKDTIICKEVIGGLLLELQTQCFQYLETLDNGEAGDTLLQKIALFIDTELGYKLPAGFSGLSNKDKQEGLRRILNRPIRVCGMVENDGEPGGGPFWTDEPEGSQTLQIAEAAQIAPEQKGLMASSTYFNPVDIVCGIKDYLGNKFDLSAHVDSEAGLISLKSKDGRELKAQELPGLWNGAMSRWNTVFVEVPSSTFSPVKTINDLLRPEHQPEHFEECQCK